jgi:hypothetical protein
MDAALTIPAAREAAPRNRAGESSPEAIRCERFGTGMRTR